MYNFMGTNYGLYDNIPNPTAPQPFVNAPAHSFQPTGQHSYQPTKPVQTGPVGQHPGAPQGANFLAQQQAAQAQYQQNLKLAEALRAQQAQAQQDDQAAQAQYSDNGGWWVG